VSYKTGTVENGHYRGSIWTDVDYVQLNSSKCSSNCGLEIAKSLFARIILNHGMETIECRGTARYEFDPPVKN
jgi:hypothetical protein